MAGVTGGKRPRRLRLARMQRPRRRCTDLGLHPHPRPGRTLEFDDARRRLQQPRHRLFQQGRVRARRARFRRSHCRQAQQPVLHYNRGLVLANKGDNETALRSFDEAISLNPRYVSAHNDRANIFFRQTDYDRAISGYDDAIRLEPRDLDDLRQPRQHLPPQGRLRPGAARFRRRGPAQFPRVRPRSTAAARSIRAKATTPAHSPISTRRSG